MVRKAGIGFFWAGVVLFLVCPFVASGTDAPEWDVPKQSSETIVIPVSDAEIMQVVKEALSAGGSAPATVRKVELDEFGTVYVGVMEGQRAPVFARFVAQRVPCGDCHDAFFVYSFDRNGFLRFIPVSISKRYNKKWDAEDAKKIESRFLGQPIGERLPFNPFVDTIASATMSAKIVYHTMNEAGAIHAMLVEKGIAGKCE